MEEGCSIVLLRGVSVSHRAAVPRLEGDWSRWWAELCHSGRKGVEVKPEGGIGGVVGGEGVDTLMEPLDFVCLAAAGFDSGGSRIETDYFFPKSLIVA